MHDATTDPTTSTLLPGERVGPYQLIRLLGVGGMAQVWLAQRADGAFRREVALKLPLVTRLRKHLESRFVRERDILAGLEHPNIARLYDGGIDSDGLPYLAMEFVQGRKLTAWCDANALGIRERLKLFLQVLGAVQYAHERQVVHRDIKPSNILVTDAGQARLLDFGIAKLLEDDNSQSELTRIYGRAMTPEYASPELLRGDPVDVQSDIYSLGVLLYELLCGTRPYRIKPGTSPETLADAIARREIKRPSRHIKPDAAAPRATTHEKLERDLRGDLDAIVLKALSREPGDRYPSASELSDDLQRYLNGESVKAQPARISYRVAKFALRHRFAIAVGAALLLLALSGYRLLEGKLDRVRAEATAAASVSARLPISDKSVAVLPFADLSEKHDQQYLSDGLAEALIDRLSNSPDLKVIARTSSFSFRGRNDDARTIAARLGVANLLEGSVRKAGDGLRVTVQLIKAQDSALVWSRTYEGSLNDVFKVQDEIAAKVTSELKVALNAGTPTSAGDPSMAVRNLVLKGNVYLDRNTREDLDKAVALYRESIKVDARYAVAWARLAFASLKRWNFGWGPPERALNDAREAVKRALEIDPRLVIAHYIQGQIDLLADWNWAAAAAEADRMHAVGGTDTLYELRLRADIASGLGDFNEAISNYRQIIDHDPVNGFALNGLAIVLLDAGDPQGAIATWRDLLQLRPTAPIYRGNLAGALLLSGQPAEALETAQKEPDIDVRRTLLAMVYWALGRRSESDAELKQLEAAPDPDSFGIAQIYALRSDKEAALRWLERAYRQHEPGVASIKADAYLRSLHGDPRYQDLLAKMKLNRDPPGLGN
jgi:eukaryotic-like serine/threonine-protein kinase